MDISPQFLTDLYLNIGGYLLASILGVVIYSLFNRSPKSQRKPQSSLNDVH